MNVRGPHSATPKPKQLRMTNADGADDAHGGYNDVGPVSANGLVASASRRTEVTPRRACYTRVGCYLSLPDCCAIVVCVLVADCVLLVCCVIADRLPRKLLTSVAILGMRWRCIVGMRFCTGSTADAAYDLPFYFAILLQTHRMRSTRSSTTAAPTAPAAAATAATPTARMNHGRGCRRRPHRGVVAFQRM